MSIIFGDASITSVITGSANETVVGSPPPDIQVGELMIAQLIGRDNAPSNEGTTSAPSGWTTVAVNNSLDGRYTVRQMIAWKIYEGTETELDFTFSATAFTNDDLLVIRRVYGSLNYSDPVSVFSDIESSSTVNRISPSVTTLEPNSTVVYFTSAQNGSSNNPDNTGEPANTILLHNVRTRAFSSAVRSASAYEVVVVAGDTGTREWVDFTSQSQYGSEITIVLNEEQGASINSENTDKELIEGSDQLVSFSNITSNPVSLSISYDGIVVPQPDFTLGEVVDGVADAMFTTNIGNLPYTDINHSPIDYSYIVTCEDGSELTLTGISISPSASRKLVTANNPVNDSTSIITQWIEGLAQTDDQIDYPEQVENVTLTVNSDFTHTGVVPEGEVFPSSISFDINYWDSVSGERYPVTIEISFEENNSEILEFVPASTDAISIEFFASSEGLISEQVPATTDSVGGVFNGLSNVIVNELVPSSTDSINVTFDQPVRVNEQVPAPTDSIMIFYGENLFTPSLSRTLYIKP